MYVLVQHVISNPADFFRVAQEETGKLPPGLILHHTFSAADGTKAVCIWEAESVEAVKDFLEPAVGQFSQNDYVEVPNKEGVSLPKIAVTA